MTDKDELEQNGGITIEVRGEFCMSKIQIKYFTLHDVVSVRWTLKKPRLSWIAVKDGWLAKF